MHRPATAVGLRPHPHRARPRPRPAGGAATAGPLPHLRIAVQLDRPLSTVRRWIRAVRDPGHVEWLRAQAVGWPAQLDRDVLNDVLARRRPAGPLDEALTTLATAAVVLRKRVAPRVPAWTLIAQITRAGRYTR